MLTMEEAPEEMEVRPMAGCDIDIPSVWKKNTASECGPKYVNLLVNYDWILGVWDSH